MQATARRAGGGHIYTRSMESSQPVAERPRRPEWMKVRAPSASDRYFDVKKLIHGANLNTICEEARCPNIAECWGRGTATFQILGETCTRACRYCYVNSGRPESPPDPLEPLRPAQTA
jgi:lipoyl synthase